MQARRNNHFPFRVRDLACRHDDDVRPPDQDDADPRLFRNALGRFATGVTVVTTQVGSKREGVTANSFAAVSLDPPLVLWSLNLRAPSLERFRASGHFVVNVLSSRQGSVSRQFATPRHDKSEGVDVSLGLGGCPMLDASLAIFECRTVSAIEGGDHVIFVGRVVRAHYRDGDPLVFAGGRYGTHLLLPADA